MDDDLLDLQILRVLEAVSRTGSLSRAAEELGVTQQAVSARLSRAERHLGQVLVQRLKTGSSLTPTGRTILGWAEPLLRETYRVEALLRTIDRADDRLTISAVRSIAEYFLPEWLEALRRRHPDADLRIQSGDINTVLQHVRDGSAHLGFVANPRIPGDLHWRVLVEDAMAVAVQPSHPWVRRLSYVLEISRADSAKRWSCPFPRGLSEKRSRPWRR